MEIGWDVIFRVGVPVHVYSTYERVPRLKGPYDQYVFVRLNTPDKKT